VHLRAWSDVKRVRRSILPGSYIRGSSDVRLCRRAGRTRLLLNRPCHSDFGRIQLRAARF